MRLIRGRPLHRSLLAASLLLFLLLPATRAFADPPTITHLTVEGGRILPRNPCSFPVRLDNVGQQMTLELIQHDGTTMYLANSQGEVTLTNTENQRSVVLHLAESRHEEDFADGSWHLRISGTTLMWAQPPTFAELTLLRGTRDMTFDAQGNLVSDAVNGSLTNICDALAG